MAKPHLAIFLPSMASGGAERLHASMAPLFVAAGYRLTFVLQQAEGPFLATLPPEAEIVTLGTSRSLSSILPLARYMKRGRPDVLLANLGHSNIVAIWAAMLARTGTKVIVSLHNPLSFESGADRGIADRILPFLYRHFLSRTAGVVAVSEGVADDLVKIAGVARETITVIYNPIVTSGFDAMASQPVSHPWLGNTTIPCLLAAGRLRPQKDYGTMLRAVTLVAAQRDIRLLVLGEGPELANLQELAKSLGIADRVEFLGFVANPLPYMRAASMLVMSSRFEGFGNVIVEALACGTPVVSTDCPSGPGEILENGRYGRLVPVADAEAFAEAIEQTLDKEPDRAALTARGHWFSAERAAEAYGELFRQSVFLEGSA